MHFPMWGVWIYDNSDNRDNNDNCEMCMDNDINIVRRVKSAKSDQSGFLKSWPRKKDWIRQKWIWIKLLWTDIKGNKSNVFDKRVQSRACLSYAERRKRRMKSNLWGVLFQMCFPHVCHMKTLVYEAEKWFVLSKLSKSSWKYDVKEGVFRMVRVTIL